MFCETKEDAEVTVGILTAWLAQRGLTLSATKTRIVHLTEGFDFLGFTIRRYKTPRTRTGYRLHVTPSKAAVKRLRARLRTEWDHLNGYPVGTVIARLNPIIRGWANYVRLAKARPTFSLLDRWMYRKERRWVERAHPNRTSGWQTRHYWGRFNPRSANRWVFGDKQTGAYLLEFTWFRMDWHSLVRGTASPDDPRLRAYWAARSAAFATLLRPGDRKIAKHQDYRCRVCGESLFTEEELHKHHLQPRSKGGGDTYANLELVHLYCHQQIHGQTGDTIANPAHASLRHWER